MSSQTDSVVSVCSRTCIALRKTRSNLVAADQRPLVTNGSRENIDDAGLSTNVGDEVPHSSESTLILIATLPSEADRRRRSYSVGVIITIEDIADQNRLAADDVDDRFGIRSTTFTHLGGRSALAVGDFFKKRIGDAGFRFVNLNRIKGTCRSDQPDDTTGISDDAMIDTQPTESPA